MSPGSHGHAVGFLVYNPPSGLSSTQIRVSRKNEKKTDYINQWFSNIILFSVFDLRHSVTQSRDDSAVIKTRKVLNLGVQLRMPEVF